MENLITPKLLNAEKNGELIVRRYAFEQKVSGFFYARLSQEGKIKITYGPYDFCKNYSMDFTSSNGEVRYDDILSLQYLDIETTESVEFLSIGVIDASYPYTKTGFFDSDDSLLNEIWEVGAYTAKLCTHRHRYSSPNRIRLPKEFNDFIASWDSEYGDFVVFDGPRRDRECWIGDIRAEALAIYSAFSDLRPVKASIRVFNDLQRNNGLIPGSGATRQPFLEYNFWWVISVYECYLYSNDEDFLRKTYPRLLRFFEYVLKYSEPNGLIENDNSWMWTFVRVGKVGSAECALYEALKSLSLCAKVMGDEKTALLAITQAEKVKKAINENYWNEEKGVYDDKINFYTPTLPVFLDFNCFAINFGIANETQSKRILDYLKKNHHSPYGSTTTDIELTEVALTEKSSGVVADMAKDYDEPNEYLLKLMYPHNKKIWPFMVAYEVEARFLCGDYEGAFDLIKKCWGAMLSQNATTFWEMFEPYSPAYPAVSLSYGSTLDGMNSACHGWSGWITHILSKFVLGVKPITAGFKTFAVNPRLNKIKNLRGAVPTPYGTIEITICDKNISITYPKELTLIQKSDDFVFTETRK